VTDSTALVLALLACYGVAWVLGSAKITYRLRGVLFRRAPHVLDFLECPGCIGFWQGLGLGLWFRKPWHLAIAFGFAVSTTNLILERVFYVSPNQ
jgi:hypothetical protein